MPSIIYETTDNNNILYCSLKSKNYDDLSPEYIIKNDILIICSELKLIDESLNPTSIFEDYINNAYEPIAKAFYENDTTIHWANPDFHNQKYLIIEGASKVISYCEFLKKIGLISSCETIKFEENTIIAKYTRRGLNFSKKIRDCYDKEQRRIYIKGSNNSFVNESPNSPQTVDITNDKGIDWNKLVKDSLNNPRWIALILILVLIIIVLVKF